VTERFEEGAGGGPRTDSATGQAYGWFIAGLACWFAAWGMQNVIFSWLVVGELRAGPRWVGASQTCVMLPELVLLLWAGATADRLDRRRLLIALHLAAATVAVVMAALVSAGMLTYATLIGYALCGGTIGAFHWPVRDASLSEVAGDNLMHAVTGVTMTQFGLQAVGALLAGTARWIGTPAALLIQAALVLSGVYPLCRLPSMPAAPGVSPSRGTALGEIVAGLREVWRSDRIRPPVLMVGVNGVLFIGPFFVLLPLMVRDVYGGDAGALALAYTAFPAGVIVGSLVLLLGKGIRRQGRALLIGLFAGAVFLCVFALDLPFYGFVCAVFAWGACGAVFVNTSRTLVQKAAPPAHRARVLSVYALGIVACSPIGSLGAGFAASAFGPERSCALFGCAMLVVVALAWTRSRIRHME
jgi:MFS family permease